MLDAGFAKSILRQIKECFLHNPKHRLSIIWHGGEPLLWGIENYKKIFAYMAQDFEGCKYKNSIQTNISLMNEEIIALFLKYNVHVSFSLDGPKGIHDLQRVNHNGEGTFDMIMEKIALCKEKKLSMGCIVVASKKHLGKIPELYQFMCDNNISFKFNPLFNAGEAKKNVDEYGLTPDEYAAMFIELFDLWFYDNEHKNYNKSFEEIASSLITKRTSGCLFGRNCQDSFLAISPNGDVVPCGRFCGNELIQYSYGNLHKESLEILLPKIRKSDIYNRYKYIEESSCGTCEYFEVCHGGCLHDGFIKSGDFKSKTFLCDAYKKIFAHISKRLKEKGML
jgi:uncharacterized protein